MKLLIGLHGPQGSGKDTLANMLSTAISQVVRIKFADKLYDMATAFDPVFKPDMLHKDKDDYVLGQPRLGTRRNFLQTLGTEWGRDLIHRDIWLAATIDKAERIWATDPDKLVIVTDVRFSTEAAWIREQGQLIHLDPNWLTTTSDHSSDRPLLVDQADVVLRLQKGKEAKGLLQLLQIVNAMKAASGRRFVSE